MAVVDRFLPRFPKGEGLPPGSNEIIRALGVWEQFGADGHAPSYRNVSAWGSDHFKERNFVWLPSEEGWHLEVGRFHDTLLRAAQDAGAVVIQGTMRITGRHKSGFDMSVQSNMGTHQLRTGYLVDATGRSRGLVRRLEAETRTDDGMAAAVGVLQDETGSLDASTLVESTPDGWWYASRLPDGRAAVGFMTDADVLRTKQLRDGRCWLDALSHTVHLRNSLAGCRLQGRIQVAPAYSSRVSAACGPGWIAVGDAASSHDPLSNLGIASALAQGMEAARVIEGSRDDSDYDYWVRDQYAKYLATLLGTYDLERRWDSPFWNRRHEHLASLLR